MLHICTRRRGRRFAQSRVHSWFQILTPAPTARDRAADDVQLDAEYSLHLSNWLPVELVSIDDGATGIDTVAARLPGGGSTEVRAFYQLRVVVK